MTTRSAATIGIGIDFGTSNSVAALYDGVAVRIVDIGGGSRSIPSATYLDKSFLAVTGQEAIDAYIESNTGRRVELVAIPLGEGRTSTGSYDGEGLPAEASTGMFFSDAIYDANLQGRLFYGIKRILATSENRSVPVFDRHYRLEAIITPILIRIRQALESEMARLGTEDTFNHAVIGRPVNFESLGEGGNDRALQRLATAFGNAGFSDQRFCQEPVAAAINYLHTQPERESGTLLTVDFGGGTLDFCLFRDAPGGMDLLGTHGIALGGNHIDQLLFRKLLFPLLGEGATGRLFTNESFVEARFPFSLYAELLLNWPVSYLLNQNRYLTPIREMVRQETGTDRKFSRLLDLVQFNYSYLVLEHIKRFKEAFSSSEEATLELPELDITLTLDQARFASILEPITAQFEQAMDNVLLRAGIPAQQVSRIICVGGSTQLPAIKAALQRRFPGRVMDHDIFTSVAAGLAIQDYRRRNGEAA